MTQIHLHTILNSYTMFYKPHPHVNARSLKSEVRYFDRMCENLDTKPKNIVYLIRCISRAFYAREIRAPGSQFRYNLSDAYYLAKVLCMIKHRLISNRLFTQLNVMFELSVNLFCDTVFFHRYCWHKQEALHAKTQAHYTNFLFHSWHVSWVSLRIWLAVLHVFNILFPRIHWTHV